MTYLKSLSCLALGGALLVGGPCAGAAAPEGLKVGEYACYGSGSRVLAGLGFKVLAGGRYTDLDGKERGTYRVSHGAVTFQGGHLAEFQGRNLTAKGDFVVGKMAVCEPW